jgi:hypothetical protein
MNKETTDEPPSADNSGGTGVYDGGGFRGKIDGHTFSRSVFFGWPSNGFFGSQLLPVFVKSPACKSIGFSRCDRFSWIRDNDDISSEQGFCVGV